MGQSVERRVSLPADHRSVVKARRIVRAVLHEARLDEIAPDAVLLASEVCENAVLHAGTGFELSLTLTADELRVAVTDRGSTPLERRRAEPIAPNSRAATHGRGLVLVDAIATAWGTTHDATGHQVWFTMGLNGAARPGSRPAPASADLEAGLPAWPDPAACRWLLHIADERLERLDVVTQVTELTRRLCDVLDGAGAEVCVDLGDGRGEHTVVEYGPRDGRPVAVALPLTAPLRGRLAVHQTRPNSATRELAALTARLVALAVETDWLRVEAARRRSWTTFLAETSELLAQSLDLKLTTAIVPQLVVPRLGEWCAVHLFDSHGRLELAAVTHADEAALADLRTDLATAPRGVARVERHVTVPGDVAVSGVASTLPGATVPLMAHGKRLGLLSVGRPAGRPHNNEEIALISDVARRAALAIDNAQRDAVHVGTSRALQEALLPRALPTGGGVEFAAVYLPASTGADVGGDFYDVLELDDGRWMASIGDVCGKGARAAARTGLVRDVLRVLVRDGKSPAQALELLNEVLLEAAEPNLFCTVAAAAVRRTELDGHDVLDVDLVLAGHLRPFLLRADGTGRFVGELGTAAGLIDDFAVHTTELRLHPGDALIAYTDGITELRSGTEQFGENRLRDALVGSPGRPASALVEALRSAADGFSSSRRRDDMAVLAFRADQRAR